MYIKREKCSFSFIVYKFPGIGEHARQKGDI